MQSMQYKFGLDEMADIIEAISDEYELDDSPADTFVDDLSDAISFRHFQHSRKPVDDIGEVIRDECVKGPGFVYHDQFYISESVDTRFGLGQRYCLTLPHLIRSSDSLSDLEHLLFDWILEQS